jgi:hypothetical protein
MMNPLSQTRFRRIPMTNNQDRRQYQNILRYIYHNINLHNFFRVRFNYTPIKTFQQHSRKHKSQEILSNPDDVRAHTSTRKCIVNTKVKIFLSLNSQRTKLHNYTYSKFSKLLFSTLSHPHRKAFRRILMTSKILMMNQTKSPSRYPVLQYPTR